MSRTRRRSVDSRELDGRIFRRSGFEIEPHTMIAIGDHACREQRTWLESSGASIREYSSNLYPAVGMRDKRTPALSGTNEEDLKKVSGAQITLFMERSLGLQPVFY